MLLRGIDITWLKSSELMNDRGTKNSSHLGLLHQSKPARRSDRHTHAVEKYPQAGRASAFDISKTTCNKGFLVDVSQSSPHHEGEIEAGGDHAERPDIGEHMSRSEACMNSSQSCQGWIESSSLLCREICHFHRPSPSSAPPSRCQMQ